MIEAAKCMFLKLLGEASDDLERSMLSFRDIEWEFLLSFRDIVWEILFSSRDTECEIFMADADRWCVDVGADSIVSETGIGVEDTSSARITRTDCQWRFSQATWVNGASVWT